jgi:hypothetical protein
MSTVRPSRSRPVTIWPQQHRALRRTRPGTPSAPRADRTTRQSGTRQPPDRGRAVGAEACTGARREARRNHETHDEREEPHPHRRSCSRRFLSEAHDPVHGRRCWNLKRSSTQR